MKNPLGCLALIAMSGSAAADGAPLPPAAEIAAVSAELSRLQHLSFATQREYCGYLGRQPDGKIVFTPMTRGDRSGCTPILPDTRMDLVASLHTHGAYDPDVPAEFPTSRDLLSDAREGVNGYISTPGGRLWLIHGTQGVARQICGIDCLPKDVNFRPGDDGVIRESYSLQDLLALEDAD